MYLNDWQQTAWISSYPLELCLQDTWHVETEVGAKRQQAVEEKHQKTIATLN